MKTIGILGGMAAESTVTYYQVLNQVVGKALGDHHSARCILYSVDFQDIVDTHRSGDPARAADLLCAAARALERAGADVLILATNTMHIVAPQIQAAVGLPLLHIAQVTADRLKAEGIERVGLLGTTFTMEMDFYKAVLQQNGLEALIPEQQAVRDELHRIIDEELAFGDIKAPSRAFYTSAIEALRDRGAQGVILGCTEIGLLIGQQDSCLPVFDTARIHAEEAALYALRAD
ncbi:MAG: aspartate/glutamate racemase family protein [Clostridiales bacterium]|nr:aspartate/glutamate racemase family protein [Clostridiales bacterium]